MSRRGTGRRGFWTALSAILMLGGILDLTALGTWPAAGVFRDVAVNGTDALRVLAGQGPQVFFQSNGGREGAFIDLVALSFRVFGVGVWQARLPSVLFGLLGILGLGLLGRYLWGRRAGLAAAFLAAVSPGYVMLSRSGFRASMVPAIAAFAVLSFFWALECPEDGRPTVRWLAAGAVVGLGFHSYTSWPVVPVVLAAWGIVCVVRHRARLRHLLIWGLAAILVGLPPVLARQLVAVGNSRAAGLLHGLTPWGFLQGLALEAQMPFFLGDANWRHNVPSLPLLMPLVGGLLLLAGLAFAFRRRDGHRWPLLALLAAGMLPAAVTPLASLPHLLRSTAMLPVVFLMAGFGFSVLDGLSRRRFPGRGRWLLPILLLAGCLATAGIAYPAFVRGEASAAKANNAQDWAAGTADRTSGPPPLVFLPSTIGRDISEAFTAPYALACWPRTVTVVSSLDAIPPGGRAFCEADAWTYYLDPSVTGIALPYGIFRDTAGYLVRPAGQ